MCARVHIYNFAGCFSPSALDPRAIHALTVNPRSPSSLHKRAHMQINTRGDRAYLLLGALFCPLFLSFDFSQKKRPRASEVCVQCVYANVYIYARERAARKRRERERRRENERALVSRFKIEGSFNKRVEQSPLPSDISLAGA